MAKEAKLSKFDVSKHTLVPKHTKLSESEKKTLLKKYNITVKELPKILINDPAIIRFDPKVNDVIKIERGSHTARSSVFYRGVVNA
ncbi:DNA-directed RNA polymerase subunit H [Candidatus Woesearchaeota archaeon]|nr:DNA-directed RNA polymerase subunit H [Candidatus Woesearchaeota archaeon]MBT7928706.1 DNA-directed RNA polymerase subunit H [Candidatus Peregrinibacteria bacterium]MBT3537673.1 DNA-directed RNA polymerase subunit H [Candidatus Woesearchaeota archaeon]MBT4697804.1 DNA-directed RNA polymerase subunit H [Candidatus Woesearchaeota archaeon]MBT4716336.1 DNA-directed RNA polymerase subunit H [Candidatus Woesearchaeota archaeon]